MDIEKSSEENKEKSKDDIPFTKFQILRNVAVISIGFLFIFIPFQSITNLQSTLNKEEGLGTGGLAIIYGALVISCMFLPSCVISHLGCKWTIAASMVCYLLYMAANFHAVWSLIVPASVIIGLGAAPLWSAKCSYLTRMAMWYALLTNSTAHHVMSRFFGFFFMVYQTFSTSYISCTIGIGNVGYVMIGYGIVNAICSVSFGKLMMYVGQIPLFAFAFVVHGGTQTGLLLWQPQQEPVYIIYIFAGLWGIGDAVIQAQVNALYGFLFKDNLEPAFSNYRLFEAIGFLIAFAWSNFLKTYVKLYICIGFLTVGMGMYGIVEMLERTNKKKGLD
ncbi:protein unc-93 homolog A-like [Mytilus californianus]|uniref:protein unc-93 homolog A-like n=1 Tax=Mytilus californianus TaxID=6549 RepID=UPI0022483E40|nr:protein unc-93 homolog A-like [Mytilus californianus]